MIRRKLASGNVVAILSAVFLTVCITLCGAQKALCQQKVVTPQSAGKPAAEVSQQKVDMVQVYKNQLQGCETERQALSKENDACQKEKKDLQQQNKDLQQQKANLQKKLDEFTKLGGSSVKAYCKSDTVSASTAGATTDCGSTGYMCEPVSGLCRTSCSVTTQCAPGFACDRGYSWKCVK